MVAWYLPRALQYMYSNKIGLLSAAVCIKRCLYLSFHFEGRLVGDCDCRRLWSVFSSVHEEKVSISTDRGGISAH